MKNLSRWIGVSLTALVIGALACTSTTFVSTWSAPDAKPVRLAGKKVVAVFLTKTGTVRRRAEDAMVRELSARGAQGVPSYSVLSEDEAKDPEGAKAKLSSLGFEGAVVMRVVGRESDVDYMPGGAVWVGPHYHHFWGYWGWGWGTVWEPGYLRVEKVVKVETLVYSVTQDELIWAGVSKTVDPSHVDDLVSDLAKAITDQMAKAGLLQKT